MAGNKIKELRKSKGITQRQLADALGVAQSTIGMIESGQNIGSTETLNNIAKYFNVPIDYLLTTKEKLDVAINAMDRINELAREALSKPELDFKNTIYAITPYFDGERFTDEEQKEIINFVKYVISKRNSL